MTGPAAIEPEDKDWTFVIEQGCAECGFDAGRVNAPEVAERLRATVPRWTAVLARTDAAVRPAATVWSPAEYGCHVRDVCRIMRGRVELMLTEPDPLFPNWDQDRTAVEERYWSQDAAVVAAQYAAEASATADVFAAITDDAWPRHGRRSNGSAFTVASLAVYFLHDIEHHLYDVHG